MTEDMPPKGTPKLGMARLIRSVDLDRSFDLLFWKEVGAEGRFEAAWQMVLELGAMRGMEIGESRLQRSVQGIQRAQS